MKQLSSEILEAHDEAVRAQRRTYIDPQTGYTVFTAVAHLLRGYCCGSGCRHCPYDDLPLESKPD